MERTTLPSREPIPAERRKEMMDNEKGLPKPFVEQLQRLLGEDPVMGVKCPKPCIEYHEGTCDAQNACSRMLKD
jgi:hypothetical protein